MDFCKFFKMDCKRLWHNGELLWKCLFIITFALLACTTMDDFFKINSVMYTMSVLIESHIFLLSFMLAFLFYGDSLIIDFRHWHIRQELLEGKLSGYVCAKTLMVFLSSVFAVGIEVGASALIIRMKKEWYLADISVDMFNTQMGGLLSKEHYLTFLFLVGIQMGILAGILSLISLYISLFVQNKILTGTITVLTGMVLQFLGNRLGVFNLFQLFIGTSNFNFQGKKWIQRCIALGIICYVLFSILIYSRIKRRLRNE